MSRKIELIQASYIADDMITNYYDLIIVLSCNTRLESEIIYVRVKFLLHFSVQVTDYQFICHIKIIKYKLKSSIDTRYFDQIIFKLQKFYLTWRQWFRLDNTFNNLLLSSNYKKKVDFTSINVIKIIFKLQKFHLTWRQWYRLEYIFNNLLLSSNYTKK